MSPADDLRQLVRSVCSPSIAGIGVGDQVKVWLDRGIDGWDLAPGLVLAVSGTRWNRWYCVQLDTPTRPCVPCRRQGLQLVKPKE